MKMLRYSMGMVMAVLLTANLFVFVYGVNLGNQISHYEREIKRLKQENTALEKQAIAVGSLDHAASMAAALNFSRRATPVYLESLKYAANR